MTFVSTGVLGLLVGKESKAPQTGFTKSYV